VELLYTAHVPAGEGPFPTIVALHGWGASAHDLLGLAPLLHGGRALVLCPQGPVQFEIGPGEIGPGATGYGWFPLTRGAPLDPAEFDKGIAALEAFLTAARARYPIDPARLIFLGFSQGGVMAYDLALREPDRCAGLVALSSWLPQGLAGELPARPGRGALPTLVIHGTRDPQLPIELGRASRDALRSLGIEPSYHEVEMGHEIARPAMQTLVKWLDGVLDRRG
jgi:phospholipase/carboxylesterase